MECEEIRSKIATVALQVMDRVDVENVESHLADGCPDCAALFIDGLHIRRKLAPLKEQGASNRRRMRKRITWARLLSSIVLLLVLTALGRVTVRFAVEATEKRFIRRLEKAVFRYRVDHGSFPPTDVALAESLTEGPAGSYLPGDEGRMDHTGRFVDHWGNHFHYRIPGLRNPGLFDLWSAGRDRDDEGGRGDDLNNWNERLRAPDFGP